MPKSLTIEDVCELNTRHAVRTGDFSRFEAWIHKLNKELDDARYMEAATRSNWYGKATCAKMKRAARVAERNLKKMEAAQASAWTEYNKTLLRGVG